MRSRKRNRNRKWDEKFWEKNYRQACVEERYGRVAAGRKEGRGKIR